VRPLIGEALQICQLSAPEIAALNNFGVRPDCRHHNHLRRTDAERLVESKLSQWVGPKRRAIVATRAFTDRGYDYSFGPNDDRVPVIAKPGDCHTWQLLHGGEKRTQK
jgi:IS5 family transposase